MDSTENRDSLALKPHISVPLYRQLEKRIRAMILNDGGYSSGDMLPSENQMMEQYGVSRATVRQAIKELEHEGLVRKEQGLGTMVCDPKLIHPLLSATSFTNDTINKGGKPGSITIFSEEVIPDQRTRNMLRLASGETIIKLERIRTVNNCPVGLQVASLAKKHMVGIEQIMLKSNDFSLYELLTSQCGLKMGEAVETIEAGLSNERESLILNIPVSSAMLRIERLIHTVEGEPFEVCQMAYRGDRYKSVVKMMVTADR